MFDAHVLKVLIASPSDVRTLRDSVEQSLHEWNTDRAAAATTILLPRRWESGAVPQLTGEDGQSVINHQLVDDADIIIGVFSQTLGSATPRAASGTAEELERARDAGKPVHVYFSAMPIDRDHDREQLAALDAFKKSLQEIGLYGTFDTAGDLEKKVRAAIEHDIAGLGLGSPTLQRAGGAEVAGHYKYEREADSKGRMRTRRERIEIVNAGTSTAEDVQVTLVSEEEGLDAPSFYNAATPFTLAPNGGTFALPILVYAGSANHVRVELSWKEDGEERQNSHSLSLL